MLRGRKRREAKIEENLENIELESIFQKKIKHSDDKVGRSQKENH